MNSINSLKTPKLSHDVYNYPLWAKYLHTHITVTIRNSLIMKSFNSLNEIHIHIISYLENGGIMVKSQKMDSIFIEPFFVIKISD